MRFAFNLVVFIALSLNGCSDSLEKKDVLGQWHVVRTTSRGSTIPPVEYLGMEKIEVLADGTFLSTAPNIKANGSWTLKGERILLESPEVKDLQGKVLSPARSSEWHLFLTQDWMQWNGTSRYGHEHIKITLKLKLDEPIVEQFVGTWLTNDGNAELTINQNKTFWYTSDNNSFQGTWLSDSLSLRLVSDQNSNHSIQLDYLNNRLYPQSAGSDYYFEMK